MSTSVHEDGQPGTEIVEMQRQGAVARPLPVDELSVEELVKQSGKIEQAMRLGMQKDMHYGVIPGVKKPSLFKPGAEKLCVLFRLAPHYQSEKIWHADGHLTASVVCTLIHAPSGMTVATGEGLCTSRETKYAYRTGERVCPVCGEPQVRLGRARGNKPGNWYCWAKMGGCGETWPLEGEQADLFAAMETGRVDNPDLPDTFNTVLKMADKRALVAAVLNATAASDVFTQDVEDMAAARDAETATEQAKPETDVPFRPDDQLLPDAPPGAKEIVELAMVLDRELIEWLAEAVTALYGAPFSELKGDARKRAGLRSSNAIAKIRDDLYATGDFPPPTDDQYREVFAWAFDGIRVEGPGAASEVQAALDEEALQEAMSDDVSDAVVEAVVEPPDAPERVYDGLGDQGHIGTAHPDE